MGISAIIYKALSLTKQLWPLSKNQDGGPDKGVKTVHREAHEEIVTVLFLDIVGFSAASLARTPVEAFRELKVMFDRIARIVRQHGGTVDRTLGDGLLAYFAPNDPPVMPGVHADRALACGVAILRAQIEEMLASDGEDPAPVLPVRIGINSGTVYMGDLGSDERRDFTIIGSAVNLGQRLEAACEINRIMIGEATMEYATQFSAATTGMRRRPILAKSYRDPVNAFEYDPFINDPEAANRSISIYRAFARIDRTEDRLPCENVSLVMATTYGFAGVVNISRSGVLLRFDQYIARGAVIYVSEVLAKFEHLDAPSLFLEVRWGTPESDGTYLHGCQLKSLNDDQKAELWDLLKSAVTIAEGDEQEDDLAFGS